MIASSSECITTIGNGREEILEEKNRLEIFFRILVVYISLFGKIEFYDS